MVSDTLRFFESKRALIADAVWKLVPTAGPSRESMERIAEFCARGKMIRGCLVFLGSTVSEETASHSPGRASPIAATPAATPAMAEAGSGLSDPDLPAAAAMELFQAGLLIHDDIMDQDEIRRGAPTIHARYASEAAAGAAGAGDGAKEPALAPGEARRLGESLGICVGDLCYFEGFAVLARALQGNGRQGDILGLCGSGLGEVAVAQMSDVAWGAGSAEVPEEEILGMYRGKTAHYSFSLPLAVGALAAQGRRASAPGGPGSEVVSRLYELGEELGILFQIRDDELGLFGSSASIGKEAGSDLREGKKTLIRSRILAAAPPSELPRLRVLFGGGVEARPEDIEYIGRLSEELGVARSIAEMAGKAEAQAQAIVEALPGLSRETRGVLEGLVEYVTKREK